MWFSGTFSTNQKLRILKIFPEKAVLEVQIQDSTFSY